MLYVVNTYVWPMNEILVRVVSWVLTPILLFYTVFKTIPRAKKPVTIVLASLWLALGVYDLVFAAKDFVPRLIQSLALALFIYYVARNQIAPNVKE